MDDEKTLLALSDIPMSRKELSRVLEIDETKLSNILRKLKKDGMVELRSGKKWYITDKGIDFLTKTKECREKFRKPMYKLTEEQETKLLIISELYRVSPDKLINTILYLLRQLYDLGITKKINTEEIIDKISKTLEIIELLQKNNKNIEEVILTLNDIEKVERELENLEYIEIKKLERLKKVEYEIKKREYEYSELNKYYQRLKKETEELERQRNDIIEQIVVEASEKSKKELEGLKKEKEILEEKIKNLKYNLVLNSEWVINFLSYVSFEIEKIEKIENCFDPLVKKILCKEIDKLKNSIRAITRPLLSLISENIQIIKEKIKAT